MSSNFKKVLVGLAIVFSVAVSPFGKDGETNEKNIVTLGKDNLVLINGEITSESVSETISQLKSLDNKSSFFKKKPIYLFLYTPGGSIQAGLELMEAVRGLHRPVYTVTLFAASMGFQLVQSMGDRLILKNGTLMSHHASGEFEGMFGGNYPSQMDNRYGFWKKRLEEMDKQTVARTKGKQTLQSYRNQYENELWLTGTDSVEEGYADAIVAANCNSSLDGTVRHSVNFMGLDINYETSECPLITGLLNIKIGSAIGPAISTILAEDIKTKFISHMTFNKNFSHASNSL